MRADDDSRLGDVVLDRTGEQRAGDTELEADRLDRQEVLLGQSLGRRHQRPRPVRLDGAEQRVERDNRLPGTDVPLQQPFHRTLAGQVSVDLGDRLLLVGRELERQHRPIPRYQPAGIAERRRPFLLPPLPPAREPQLQDEQLVERQPTSRLLAVGLLSRPVQRDQRIGPAR
jgi:hypothetical protein